MSGKDKEELNETEAEINEGEVDTNSEVDVNGDVDGKKKPKIVRPPVQEQLDELYKTLKECSKTLTVCASTIKLLNTQIEREKKQALTALKAGKDPNAPKPKVRSFENVVPLSDVMCEFLNVEKGTKKARNDVKAEIRDYIRKKELNNPDNRREIIPDKKLRTILHGYTDDITLDYWNMEKYLKPNFIKETIKNK